MVSVHVERQLGFIYGFPHRPEQLLKSLICQLESAREKSHLQRN
jgi:hypothetical protein